MKRLLIKILVLMLCVAMTAGAAIAETIYVSSTGSGTLNLRSGPGKDYGPVGYVHHGDNVTSLGTSGEWSKIATADGKTGWIKTKYIDGTTKDLGSGTKTVTVPGGGNLNLRTGPGTNYGVRSTVKNGASVKVIGTEDDWVKVSVVGGKTGWIMAKYIGAASSGSSGSSSGSSSWWSDSSASSTVSVYHVTGSTLNVRTGAGTGYGKVGTLKKGDGFKVVGSSGNWFQIQAFNGVKGWVSKNYAASGATATVTGNKLNLRQGAGTSTTSIAKLSKGTWVTVDSITGNWAHVTTGFQTGYVSMNYLRF